MLGIIGIVALLTVLGLSLVITRVATVALTFTGLTIDVARFQARSAFTGTGFTTREAECILNHPVRRRIIMALMLIRSAGVITIILSIILSFVGSESAAKLYRLLWLVGGVLVLWLLSLSQIFDRLMRLLIAKALKRWTNLDIKDYISLLRLTDEYVIRELRIKEGDWLAGRTISNCGLREEGVTILGIHRSNNHFVGVPRHTTRIQPGDTLVLYGRSEGLANLDQRRSGSSGDTEHREAMEQQQEAMNAQDREEADYFHSGRNP